MRVHLCLFPANAGRTQTCCRQGAVAVPCFQPVRRCKHGHTDIGTDTGTDTQTQHLPREHQARVARQEHPPVLCRNAEVDTHALACSNKLVTSSNTHASNRLASASAKSSSCVACSAVSPTHPTQVGHTRSFAHRFAPHSSTIANPHWEGRRTNRGCQGCQTSTCGSFG